MLHLVKIAGETVGVNVYVESFTWRKPLESVIQFSHFRRVGGDSLQHWYPMTVFLCSRGSSKQNVIYTAQVGR